MLQFFKVVDIMHFHTSLNSNNPITLDILLKSNDPLQYNFTSRQYKRQHKSRQKPAILQFPPHK